MGEKERSVAEIRASILNDIKREGRRLSVAEARARYGYYGPEALEAIAALSDAGILLRGESAPMSQTGADLGRSIEDAIHGIVREVERSFGKKSRHRGGEFELYRRKLSEKAQKSGKGLIGHIISFITVNATLAFINFTTSPGMFWAAIPAAAWSIGLAGNIADSRRYAAQAEEAEALPELDEGRLAEYKAINKERDGMAGHLLSAIMVPALLLVINLTTGPATPWFLIPSAIIGFTGVAHAIGYAASMPGRVRRFYDSIGVKGGRRELLASGKAREGIRSELGAYAALYHDAERAMREVADSLSRAGDSDAAQTKADLSRYMDQVRLLAQTANELDGIVATLPLAALSRDKAALAAKIAGSSEALQAEYRAGIAEIEKQENSCRDLKEQRERIGLRLSSSVNQLNQMRLDLAKVKAAGADVSGSGGAGSGASDQVSALARIRARSEELSVWLEDLKSGHLEIQEDPFAELERLDREGKLDAR